MCLSTVYKNKVSEDSILMKNVMSVEEINKKIIFTDLMERKMEVYATLKKVDLVGGTIIIEEKEGVPDGA